MKVNIRPKHKAAYTLLQEGTLALSQATENGIAIDMDYCLAKDKHLTRQIRRRRERLLDTKLAKLWRKYYGTSMNWDSNHQLADIIYKRMGHEAKVFTENGNPSTSQNALEALGLPEIDDLIAVDRLQKAKGTFLASIIREAVQQGDQWFIHPSFALNTVQTFRSSSFDPNFHNFPKRIKEIMNIVRRSLIPRHDRLLGEVDFSGAEIRAAYCYHLDPAMYDELTNPNRDMHRDMAMECYHLTEEQLGPKGTGCYKTLRHCGKNGFVFPAFYGDYYKSIAENMWAMIHLDNLKTSDGILLPEHLATQGIHTQLDFEDHMAEVEHRFWNERFPVYNNWRNTWYRNYLKHGQFQSLTGFMFKGFMKRNQVINFAVQGSAFHMLLWSFIRLTQIATRERWKTLLIGQIHDSIVFDFHPDEVDHVLRTAQRVMTEDLPKAWKWIKVPLEVEADVGPVNGSWNTAKEYPIQ